MKNVLKTVILFFIILISFSGKAYCAVLSSKYISEEIKKDLITQISSIIGGTVNIKVNTIPYKTIQVSNGDVSIITSLNTKLISPLTVARVKVLVNGNEEFSFGVPIQISVQDKVWVVKDTIKIGESLSFSGLTLEDRDISYLIGKAAKQDFTPSGQIVKKNFKSGDILDTRYIESPPDVVKRSTVSVLFQTNTVTVTIPAESLEDGKMGDYIRVRSKKYRKDYTGKIINTNTVLVTI